MCIKNKTTGTEPVKTTKPLTCYHCGRMIWEDPRGHRGCLNTKCRGYLWGAKRYSKEQLKQVRK